MKTKEKRLVIILCGIIVLALAYFLGFQRFMESKEQLETQNNALRMQYSDLSAKAAKAKEYEALTEEMNGKMEVILANYPSYLQIENSIMDIAKLEDKTKSYVSSLTISDPVAVDVITQETSTDATGTQTTTDTGDTATSDGTASTGDGTAAANGTTTDANQQVDTSGMGYQLYDVSASITFDTKYNGLKQLLKLVVQSEDKKKVDSLMATFDNTTGGITGTMVMDSYFLYGLDKPYEDAEIPDMPHGTDNIFGSVD